MRANDVTEEQCLSTYLSYFEKVGNFVRAIEKFLVNVQCFPTLFLIHVEIFFYKRRAWRIDRRAAGILPSRLIIPSLKAAYKRIRSLIRRKKQLLITPLVSSLGVTYAKRNGIAWCSIFAREKGSVPHAFDIRHAEFRKDRKSLNSSGKTSLTEIFNFLF